MKNEAEIRGFTEKIQRFKPEVGEGFVRFIVPGTEIVKIDYVWGGHIIKLKGNSELRILMHGVEYVYPVEAGFESVELRGKPRMKLKGEYVEVKINVR